MTNIEKIKEYGAISTTAYRDDNLEKMGECLTRINELVFSCDTKIDDLYDERIFISSIYDCSYTAGVLNTAEFYELHVAFYERILKVFEDDETQRFLWKLLVDEVVTGLRKAEQLKLNELKNILNSKLHEIILKIMDSFNQSPAVYVSRLIDLYNVVHADSFAWFAISQEIKKLIINHVFYQDDVNIHVSVIEIDE
jgi:hypothetical protein